MGFEVTPQKIFDAFVIGACVMSIGFLIGVSSIMHVIAIAMITVLLAVLAVAIGLLIMLIYSMYKQAFRR